MDFDVLKARGRRPGKFRYTHPVIDYSAASQKTRLGRGGELLFPFAAFGGRSQGNVGQRCSLRGTRGKKSPNPTVPISAGPPLASSLCETETDKKKTEPLMNGWRRENECRHYGQMESLWA